MYLNDIISHLHSLSHIVFSAATNISLEHFIQFSLLICVLKYLLLVQPAPPRLTDGQAGYDGPR